MYCVMQENGYASIWLKLLFGVQVCTNFMHELSKLCYNSCLPLCLDKGIVKLCTQFLQIFYHTNFVMLRI